jgi:hypothetical protein
VSISFGMILFGSLLLVAGWQNKSLSALARGDSTVAKGPVLAGGADTSSASSTGTGPSPAAQGKGGSTVGKGGQGADGGTGGAW